MADNNLRRGIDIFVLIFAIVFFGTVFMQKVVPGLQMHAYADFYLAAILGLFISLVDYTRRRKRLR